MLSVLACQAPTSVSKTDEVRNGWSTTEKITASISGSAFSSATASRMEALCPSWACGLSTPTMGAAPILSTDVPGGAERGLSAADPSPGTKATNLSSSPGRTTTRQRSTPSAKLAARIARARNDSPPNSRSSFERPIRVEKPLAMTTAAIKRSEGSRGNACAFGPQDRLRPLIGDLFAQLGAHLRNGRELVAPFPRAGRIDHKPRVEALLPRRNDGIQRPAPGSLDEVVVLLRLGPRAHRPDHVVEIRHVNVLIYHDDQAAQIGAGVAHRGDVAGLASMAGIALSDGDGNQQPSAARLMAPHFLDIGDACPLDLLPHQRRPHQASVGGELRRRLAGR